MYRENDSCRNCTYVEENHWEWQNNVPNGYNRRPYQVDVKECNWICRHPSNKNKDKLVDTTHNRSYKDNLLDNGCKDYCNKYKKIIDNLKGKKIEFNYSFPTEKQIKTLTFITLTLGVVFEGKTKSEASIFINEHLNLASWVDNYKKVNTATIQI